MSRRSEIVVAIADIAVAVHSPLSAAELGIEKRLGPFFGRSYVPAARVSLEWKECAAGPAVKGGLIYDPGSIWKMYRKGKEYFAGIRYPRRRSGHGNGEWQGVLRAGSTWERVTLTERRVGRAWQSLLNSGAGELVLRTRILFANGLVFHASGIDDNGRGILFAGHSGAGKSTQTGLWAAEKGVVVMNDDRIAVRISTAGALCYGTPWGGAVNIARNHRAPLSAVVILEQGPENRIMPLGSAAAAPFLAARAFLPHWDGSLMKRALENLNKILAAVPVFRLWCRPGPAAVPLVRSVL
jgi:hypothetical protein